MTTTQEPDLGDDRIRALLRERAGSVRPNAAPVGQITRRAARTRHRRRSVAIGGALAAVATVGAVVVTGRHDGDAADLQVGATVPPGPSTGAPTTVEGGLTYVPVPGAPTEAAVGPPLRMGLDVAGATATSAMDVPEADLAPALPAGVMVDLQNGTGTRRLSVSALFDVPDQPPAGPPLVPVPTTIGVDLAWVSGSLTYIPVPLGPAGAPMDAVQLEISSGDDRITFIGVGLTDEEVIAVGRGASIGDGQVLHLASMPIDLVPGEPRNPWAGAGGGGIRSEVVYRLADGSDAIVDVESRPGSFAEEIDRVRAAPTADVHLVEVRGADAVVRWIDVGDRRVVTVTWIEPSGNLVTVRLEPAEGASVDPATVVDGIAELDEATFQELLVDPGPR